MKLNAKKMTFIILTMLSVAFFDNVRGVLLPSFVRFFSTDYKIMGTLALFSTLAYMIGSLLGGQIASIIGKEKLSRAAAFMMATGILITAFSLELWQLFLGFIIVSFANSIAMLVINITIPFLDIKNHAWLMNFVHFIYGIGSTIAVKSSGYLVEIGWTFRLIYLAIGVLYLAVLLLSLFISLPEKEIEEDKDFRFNPMEKKLLLSFALALGFYAAAEMQTGLWLISYLMKSFHFNEDTASSYLAVFFLIFSLGRLVGGLFAHRFGYLKTVTISLLLACSLYSAGIVLAVEGLNLLVISGVFFSICYPTILLSLKNYFPNSLSRANGIVVFAASGINMLLSFVMWYMADELGVASAIWIIPISLLLSLCMLCLIQLQQKKYSY